MALTLAIIGTVLGVSNLLWSVWTWRGSGSRVRVETSFRVFPGLAKDQLMNLLAQTKLQLPAELANVVQNMLEYHAQLPIPTDLSYPASPELMAAMPAETTLVVATITNTGRLPVTIQRCQWQTSQPGLMEVPNMPPGVSFPHRLEENDRCISVITLASIMAPLDAPLRDKSVTSRKAWPVVEVANRRKPISGNSLTIPLRNEAPPQSPKP